jgi:YhcH/YjgK/YiaL family protein
MNAVPLSTASKEIITPYDDAKDIEFISVTNFVNHKATPSNFFIFFPGDAHRSQLKDGTNSQVKKVVIKLRVE